MRPRALAALLVALAGCGGGAHDGRGAATKRELAARYLAAVEHRDAAALDRLTAGRSTRSIQRLLRENGGRRLVDVHVTFHAYDAVHRDGADCASDDPGSGALRSFVVVAREVLPRRRRIREVVPAHVAEGRCYLALESDEVAEEPPAPPTVEGVIP